MKSEILGLRRGTYDCKNHLFECYHNARGVNLVFADFEIEVFYHWAIKGDKASLIIGSPFDPFTPEEIYPRRNIVGLKAGYYVCDKAHCVLSANICDFGVILVNYDYDMEIFHKWVVDEKRRIKICSSESLEDVC